jgi:hypothetical protein
VGLPHATPIDFLIAPHMSKVRAGAPVSIDRELEAVVTPGLRLAFRNRRENKDAYDLHWLITHYGRAVEDVGVRLKELLDDGDAERAVTHLRGDFAHLDSAGPRAVAAFLLREGDDGFRADVAGVVGRLIAAL